MVDKANNISVYTPNLEYISDGNYVGEYSISPVSVKVEASVKNSIITDITFIEHSNGLGSSAESITGEIVSNQSLEIDAISGATVSSKCILKAVENAIKNGELE